MATDSVHLPIANSATGQADISTSATDAVKELPQRLIDQMTAMFGYHSGYRTTHAKGLLVEGTFEPTKEAKTLSLAPHFNNSSTRIVARFSVGGGVPDIPDAAKQATPKGVAVRFLLDESTHTDIIAHSFNGFATNSGQDFLTFLQLFSAVNVAKKQLQDAIDRGGDTSKETRDLDHANQVFETWLKTQDSAKRFVESPSPNPFNYGTITYYQPNTHILSNANGDITHVRYRLDPVDGEHLFPDGEAPSDPNYLEDDLLERFPGKSILFDVQAHIADADDIVDDATIPYKSTKWVPVGTIEIDRITKDNENKQQHIAFSPQPESGGVQGISSSEDPLIGTRKGVYYISAKQRREAKRK
ncbi:catalase [Metarhizium rileyi]|uniref:Catalase n=1 Tax=Metarhizium rileyi (strain RCEF 4871) TaxID=1649241 RepID=A0A166VWN5_METRR|nr:catalase [Metarhizium rileyi RCEF 4871]